MLENLARQLNRMLAGLASLRDDVNVLTAIVQRLDNRPLISAQPSLGVTRSRSAASPVRRSPGVQRHSPGPLWQPQFGAVILAGFVVTS